MKKVTLFAAMAALVFASCNKDENLQLDMSNHTITASMETDSPETRTAFDRTSGALYWIAGDDIAVLNTNGSFTEYTLTEGAGTANGKFEGTQIGSNSIYALHPYSSGHKYENSALTFNMPTTYTYADTEKGNEYGAAPMIAQTEETDASNFYFEHLGGAFCFTIKNLPATTTYFKFEADEQITGEFPVETNTETGKLEISLPNTQAASGTTYAVTINFPTEESATDKKFFIPLPVGTIEGFKISLGTAEGETWSYTSTASNTIIRKRLLAMPEVTLYTTVDGSVATAISTIDQLKSAFANGGTYTLDANITVGETLTLPKGKTLILNLGSYTLTSTVAYSNDSKAIVNNGKLTITSNTEGGIVTETRGVYNEAGSEAILNCNITSSKSNAVCNYFASKLTINGGKYESKLTNGNQGGVAVRMGDNTTDNAWILEINGGTFTAPYTALHLINNYYGLETAGSATINGGTFNGEIADIGAGAVKNITISKNCSLDVIKNLSNNPSSYSCEITGTVMCDLQDNENHYSDIFSTDN
ncbi:MAG: hypothetical protein IJ383_02000 [Bacteroidales bacterium]|nr:hypothetical protein [Bacteroidales bacterium]